jgi:hypothetical protein
MNNLDCLRIGRTLQLLPRVITSLLLAHQSLAMPTLLEARNITADGSITTEKFEPGWTAGPTSRGTLTLVFSCVITLFLCVWTTIQINIEPERITNTTLSSLTGVELDAHQRRQTWVKRLQQFLDKRWVRKLSWSCIAITFPETVLSVAMYERRAAIRLNNAMVKIMPPIEVAGSKKKQDRWNMTLSYYAIMGGFCISDCNRTQHGTDQPDTQENTSEWVTSAASGEEAVEAKLASHNVRNEAKSANNSRCFTLTPEGILLVAKMQPLPNIRPEDILDKSKANKLTKAIVFFQALWMIVQVISRMASGLPITLLELHTCVHTFYALATYATWWDKPVDVELATPVPVDANTLRELRNQEQSNDEEIATLSPLGWSDQPPLYLTSRAGLGKLCFIDILGEARNGLGIKQGYFGMVTRAYVRLQRSWMLVWREILAGSFAGVAYGLLHLAVWKHEFPTRAEQILWRVSAVITASTCLFFSITVWAGGKKMIVVYATVLGLMGVPVLVVRLFLLFESFFSLRKLPLGSYEVPVWSEIWPHLR